jgi:SH3-like domain-containing protein
VKTLALIALSLAAGAATGADFRSIAEQGAIMYDAPSAKAKRLYVASRDYPVEVMVNLDAWVKVRDVAGELVWVEKKSLSERRTVLVTAPVAEVRQSAAEQSPVAFRVEKGVALELAELGNFGWARVRLRDGRAGFVKLNQVWGL